MSGNRLALITGGAGFIGTHLARALIDQGVAVRSLDLLEPKNSVSGVDYWQGDILEATLMDRAIDQVDVIYHLAAIVSVPLCEDQIEKGYRNNYLGTVSVLDAIHRRLKSAPEGSPKNPPRLAFASSAAVYGALGNHQNPLHESDARAAAILSHYGLQKLQSEEVIQLFCQKHALPALCFRFFNVIGEGQDPLSPYSGVMTLFKDRLLSSEPTIKIFGDGHQTRDFIAVEDIVQALLNVASKNQSVQQWKGQAINLGRGQKTSILELAQQMIEVKGQDAKIEHRPPREGDILHSLADRSAAHALLGWEPQTTVKSVIQKFLKN